MTSGRVSTSRSLLPLQIARMVREALAAEVGLRRAGGAGSSCPSRRRGRGCAARSSRRVRESFACVRRHEWSLASRVRGSLRRLRAEAISTVNGSPALRAPTPTRTSRSPAASACACSSSSLKPERPIAELGADPLLVVLAQIEHQHAAARHRDPRRFGHGARRVARRGAAPATAARRRRVSSLIGSFSSSPRFHTTFDDAAPARRARCARSSTDVRAIDGNDPRRPARRLDRQVPFAAAEIGDRQRRQQQAERARPGRPAAARHELPRVARVGAAVRLEVLLAQPQHFLQPRLVGPHRRVAGGRVELLLERRPERAAGRRSSSAGARR